MSLPKRGLARLYPIEFRAWWDMKHRCFNSDNPRWMDYGGRGITVCDRWKDSFRNFFQDMGKRPSSKHSLDRIDNDGNYTPENCRWATKTQQLRNTRRNIKYTYNGETLCISEWAERTGLLATTIFTRLKRGWPIEDALNNGIHQRSKGRKFTHNGRTQTLRQWAIELGFKDLGIINERIDRGWSVEKALFTPARSYKRSE